MYTMTHCPTCAQTERIADIDARYDDLDETPAAQIPTAVFGVPTYLLNDQVVSLGNPYLDDLDARIRQALECTHVGE